jgi:hypothetical protein
MEVFFTARARPAAPEAFDVRITLLFLANYFFSLIYDLTDLFKPCFSGAMESTGIAASQNDSTTAIEARRVLDVVFVLGPWVRSLFLPPVDFNI